MFDTVLELVDRTTVDGSDAVRVEDLPENPLELEGVQAVYPVAIGKVVESGSGLIFRSQIRCSASKGVALHSYSIEIVGYKPVPRCLQIGAIRGVADAIEAEFLVPAGKSSGDVSASRVVLISGSGRSRIHIDRPYNLVSDDLLVLKYYIKKLGAMHLSTLKAREPRIRLRQPTSPSTRSIA